MRTSGLTAMPRSILRILIWKKYLVYETHMHKNGKPAFFFFFFWDKSWCFCIFADGCIGHISREKKAGFPFIGWCMINTASKNHTQIRKIEQGMANPPVWQWLGLVQLSYTVKFSNISPIPYLYLGHVGCTKDWLLLTTGTAVGIPFITTAVRIHMIQYGNIIVTLAAKPV